MRPKLKKFAEKVSRGLGEKKEFLEWRNELLAAMAKRGKERPYGLSIMADSHAFVKRSGDAAKAFRYHANIDGRIRLDPWQVAIKDATTRKQILKTLHDAAGFLKKNPSRAENAAIFGGGNVVTCAPGEKASIFLKTDFSAGGSDILLVFAERGSKLSLIDNTRDSASPAARTIILLCEEDASIVYLHKRTDCMTNESVVSFVGKNGNVDFLSVSTVCSGAGRIEVEHHMRGDGAETTTRSLSASSNNGLIDIFNAAYHEASNTTSRIDASGVANGAGKIVYRSNISIKKSGIKRAAGEQKARFLVLSPKAEVDAIPSLNVSRREMSCSHSVSVSHLRESDLYFARSRGIERNDAAAIAIEGLFSTEIDDQSHAPYMEKFRNEALRDVIKASMS
jgi:Fe-S cluster assembly scaffold protein SufB